MRSLDVQKRPEKLKLPETERVSDFAKYTTIISVKLHEAPFLYAFIARWG
jgi:hypothetical protein